MDAMLEQQKDRVVERQWELEPCLDAAMEAMLQQHKDTLAEFQKLKIPRGAAGIEC